MSKNIMHIIVIHVHVCRLKVVTYGAGTAYHSGAHAFLPGFLVGFVLLDL